jgi:hypothetical protein
VLTWTPTTTSSPVLRERRARASYRLRGPKRRRRDIDAEKSRGGLRLHTSCRHPAGREHEPPKLESPRSQLATRSARQLYITAVSAPPSSSVTSTALTDASRT